MARRLGLHLTDRCQLDCQHCLRDPQTTVRDLSLTVIATVLEQARSCYGIERVSLTGGEPTLYPHLDQLLGMVTGHGLHWDMVTNGHRLPALLGRWSAPVRSSIHALTLSLDGATEQVHDAIRAPGSYRRVLIAAAACGSLGVPFVVQMALNRRNHQELEQVGLLAAQMGAKQVSYAWLQANGTAADQDLYLDPAAWRGNLLRLRSLSSALAIPVIIPEGHYEGERFFSCSAFRSEILHVDLAGRLTLCCLHSGTPSLGPDLAVGGDLNQISLVQAHEGLLNIIHQEQVARLAELSSGEATDVWEGFHCNRCLRRHGRPYWVEGGSAGPAALRERRRQGGPPSEAAQPRTRRLKVMNDP